MIEIPNKQSNGFIRGFFDRAKALSKLAEVYRSRQVTLLISDTVLFEIRAEAEIFQAAYGDPEGRKYWGAYLSEPIRLYSLVNLLSVHSAESAQQLEWARIATIRAFRDAAEAGEDWFIGDTGPLLAMDDREANFDSLRKIKVRPRAAVEWLLSKPNREHLVPGSLRRFMQTGPEATPTKRRPINAKIAESFVTKYLDGEQAAGRRPTIAGLEAAAKQTGMSGGREHLRTAYRRSPRVEVRRGRPPKTSSKFAKK
jgi:hypothetical protein